MRWLTIVVAALAVTVGMGVAQEPTEVTHTKDTVAQVRQNLEQGKAVLVDVREQEEWDAGHLDVARLVPLSSLRDVPAGSKELAGVPKDKVIYLHCRSGRRVLSAAPVFKEMGYDVRPLPWGYDDLVEEGFESLR